MNNLEWLWEHDRDKLRDLGIDGDMSCRDCPNECVETEDGTPSEECQRRLVEWLIAEHIYETNGIGGETNGIHADSPLVDKPPEGDAIESLRGLPTFGTVKVGSDLTTTNMLMVCATKQRINEIADMIDRDYLRREYYYERVKELGAECDEWKTKYETCEVAYKQADAQRKRYSEQIDELTAERDEWKAKAEQAEHAMNKAAGNWAKADAESRNTTKQPISQFDVPKSEETTENSTAKGDIRDFDDTREKLEADVRKWCGMYAYQVDMVYAWLWRQAAITRRECDKPNWDYCETCELTAERDELRDELAATKKHLKVAQGQLSVTLNNWEQAKGNLRRQKEALDLRAAKLDDRDAKTADEIAAEEIDRWKAKAEKAREDAETWRKACGDVLDATDEIHRIMTYHFPNGR